MSVSRLTAVDLVADLVTVMALDAQTNPHPWNEAQWLDSFAQHDCYMLRDEDNAEHALLGFAVCMVTLDEAELLLIAIDPARQGQGFGHQLLQQLIQLLTANGVVKLFLEVRESNSKAQAFYQRHHLQLAGVRKGYYPTELGRENAQLYTLELCKETP